METPIEFIKKFRPELIEQEKVSDLMLELMDDYGSHAVVTLYNSLKELRKSQPVCPRCGADNWIVNKHKEYACQTCNYEWTQS